MQPFVCKIADDKRYVAIKLPQEDSQIYIEAQGYTPSTPRSVSLKNSTNLNVTVKDSTKAIFSAKDETGKPIPVKVMISLQQ